MTLPTHPIFGERAMVTFDLHEDGWYYTNIGYRFHGVLYPGTRMFDTISDLERIPKLNKENNDRRRAKLPSQV